jgi:hypothetical protein
MLLDATTRTALSKSDVGFAPVVSMIPGQEERYMNVHPRPGL